MLHQGRNVDRFFEIGHHAEDVAGGLAFGGSVLRESARANE